MKSKIKILTLPPKPYTMEKRDDYKYMEIRDAIASINQKVSLTGVVLEYGLPKKTKGTDYFCSVKIIDESHLKPGISVNFFAQRMELLPRVVSLGDIIQVSLVTMKSHNGEVNAMFNKKFSSFALYEGKDGGNFLTYQTSPGFRVRDQDSKLIARLRKWMVDFKVDEEKNYYLFLREIKEGKLADLICKILHVCEVAKNEWIALVWDGTDCPPVKINTKLEDKRDIIMPLQFESLPVTRDLLCTFPTVGSILQVVIDRTNANHVLHLLEIGKWVKFLNVSYEVRAGFWLGVLTPSTKLRYVPNDDHLILGLQRHYDERLSMSLGRMPYWSFPRFSGVTETDHDRAPFVTLMDALTYSKVTAKFKCVVRVVTVFPWRTDDFCSPAGIYKLRLTIEDPTARINAFLYAEDGKKFFGCYPPIEELIKKRNKLLDVAVNDRGEEIEDAPRDPPWIQCCLFSYYLDKNDVWGSRRFRIFATKCVG